jgi:hypothetical protein
MPNRRRYNILAQANFGQIFKSIPHVNHSWAMKINHTVINYKHFLISGTFLSTFGDAKQKLQHWSRSRFWPNLQITATCKSLMGYGNK